MPPTVEVAVVSLQKKKKKRKKEISCEAADGGGVEIEINEDIRSKCVKKILDTGTEMWWIGQKLTAAG